MIAQVFNYSERDVALIVNRYLKLTNSRRCQLGKFFRWGNTPSLGTGVSPSW